MDATTTSLSSRLQKTISNTNGATLIYILAAFMVISFIGVTMLKASHHDVKASSDCSAMMTACQAARSGLTATETFLHGDPDSTLKILNNYLKDPKKLWILGNSTTTVPIDGQLCFNTELLSFSYNTENSTEFYATIRSNGFGKGGSTKSISSTINLSGLGWAIDTSTGISTIPKNAFYLGSGADEINVPLTVDGNTFLTGSGQFYTGGHLFKGEFRRKQAPYTDSLYLNGVTFNGPAYFIDGEIYFESNRSTFTKGFGSDADIKINGSNCPVISGEGAFFNKSCRIVGGTWNGDFEFQSTPLYGRSPSSNYSAGSGTGLSKLYAAGTAPSNGTNGLRSSDMSIMDSLNIDLPIEPPKVPIYLTDIKNHPDIINFSPGYGNLPGISKSTSITGADLNTFYENNSDKYYKDKWLIINIDKGDGSHPFAAGGTGFTGRLIILIEDESLEFSTTFFDSDPAGITFIYLGSDKQMKQLGGCSLLRGYIYCNSSKVGSGSSSAFILQTSGPMEIVGGIYVNNGTFRMTGGSRLTVTYDSTAINELGAIGLFNDSTIISVTPKDSLVLNGTINTTLLGLHY